MKKKLWITSLLAALSVSAAAGGITLAKQQDVVTTDAAEVWTVDDINDCSYGGWLDVPAAEVEVGGEKVSATATVTYPDGVTVTGDRVALNQAGVYTITYRAQVGSIHCVEEKKFTVENSIYTFQNEKSSAEYGTYTQYEANSTGLERLRPCHNVHIVLSCEDRLELLSISTRLYSVFHGENRYPFSYQ